MQRKQFFYTLLLQTGNYRGAGTCDNVWIKLFGSEGESEYIILPFIERTTSHKRNALETFILDIDNEKIGTLEMVKVGLENVGEEIDGWFLEELTIKDSISKIDYYFNCKCWLGEADGFGVSGPSEVNLFPRVLSDGQTVSKASPISARFAVNGIPARFKVKEGARAKISSSLGFAGEDAFFTQIAGKYLFIGVADGVYDWKFKGVFPGIWSRKLMENVKTFSRLDEVPMPFDLLSRAYQKNLIDGQKGSSTACVIRINLETGQLVSTNVGDSGFVIVSTSKINEKITPRLVYHSIEKEVLLGTPLQLGSHNFDQNPLGEAESHTAQLKPGDFIVLGTDGVFDNVLGEDLLSLVGAEKQTVLEKCCSLLNKCYDNVSDPKCETPYSRTSTEEMNMIFYGGKDDDMACCVVEVLPAKSESIIASEGNNSNSKLE